MEGMQVVVRERSGRGRVDRAGVRRAVARASEVLWAEQRADGSWDFPNEIGPHTTAQTLVAFRFVGRLEPGDAADAARWLCAQQLDDGSFAGRPFGREGELGATASVLAGFHAAGLADDAGPVRRARAFIEARGGMPAVVAALKQGEFAALFLAMEGLVDARLIARPTIAPLLHPALLRRARRRLNAGVLQVLAAVSSIARHLRGERGGLVAAFERRHALALLTEHQAPNRSWTGANPVTVIMLSALHALGVPGDDPRIARAVAWLRGTQRRDASGLFFAPMPGESWSTSLALRALLQAGVPRTDPRVVRAVTWLLDVQSRTPQLCCMGNPDPEAARTGGWSFGAGTENMPDTDTTGVVLGALAEAAWPGRHGDVLPGDVGARCRASLPRGRAWLLGMQNADGGWAAWTHGHPSKPAGPFMTRPLAPPPAGDPRAVARFLADLPPSLGDPATEDVTARIVLGLGRMGLAPSSREVSRAVAFFRDQQCESGAWWGRWVVCYVATTAFVLRALAIVGADLRAPWVERALAWLVARQNPDGGWGEPTDAVRDPSLAGAGPSTAPLTGLVVAALVACGQAHAEATERGLRYLVASQREDGTWDNGDFLSSLVAPLSFYALGAAVRTNPLEALGSWLAAAGAREVSPRRG